MEDDEVIRKDGEIVRRRYDDEEEVISNSLAHQVMRSRLPFKRKSKFAFSWGIRWPQSSLVNQRNEEIKID